MKKIFLICQFCIAAIWCAAQSVIFVNQAATGQQNGTSWADAFTDLQDALALAQYGDSIWIASGIYFPTATNDRTISFILKNGVVLLGGFNGTETSANDRDPATNGTRLSGNIGDTTKVSDNSLHVAWGKGLDETTLIDGLIFSDWKS